MADNKKINLWGKIQGTGTGETAQSDSPKRHLEAGEWERRPVDPADDSHMEGLPEVPGDRRRNAAHWRRLSADQKRHQSITFSVSQQELDILRSYATTLDISFSEWARNTLFKAMGRKPPKRKTAQDTEDAE